MAYVAVVEDERNILTSVCIALEGEGHTVQGFDNPVVALPKLIFAPPDLLILNGTMPGMHGIAFFLKFREFSRAPVIFLSANAEDIQDQLERLGHCADDYVGKPFSHAYLMKLVGRVLKRNAGPAPSPRTDGEGA